MYIYARKWGLNGFLVSWKCQDWGQMRILAHSKQGQREGLVRCLNQMASSSLYSQMI